MLSNVTDGFGARNRTSPDTPSFTILLSTLYSLVFVVGLLLNSLAAWIFFQIHARSSFVLYLKNIVVADLLMTLTLPFTIVTDAGLGPTWLPSLNCRYSSVLFYTCMYVSILFLGLISLDRYLKIVEPFGDSRLYSYGFTKMLSAGVWVGMVALSLPNSILSDQPVPPGNARSCTALKSRLGLRWHAAVAYINIVIFTAVLLTLLVSYVSIFRKINRSNAQFVSSASRKERRPGQNITIVLVVFFVCFVPYHLWRIPFTLSQIKANFSNQVEDILLIGKKFTLFLASCNICLDPVIYFLMCNSFTRNLRRRLHVDRTLTLHESNSTVKKTEVRRFREYSSGDK